MLDAHKRLLDLLERTIDPEHVRATEKLHEQLWAGERLPYLPCVCTVPVPEWPVYDFTAAYRDPEKNLMNNLRDVYVGAKLKDDRLYQIRPEYGVINIPELFGIPSVVSDAGRSMSEGLNDRDAIRRLVAAGMPDFADHPHNRRIREFQEFAWEVLAPYERIRQSVHMTLPDTQGPFDLACLIWGSDIFLAIYDDPELVRDMLRLTTETFIAFNLYHKPFSREAVTSAYHIAGLKLVNGGVRICDDSATLVDGTFYREVVAPYNAEAFVPFQGGWLHFCGNGNHLLPTIFNTPGVHALHLGNPDLHDLFRLCTETARHRQVLYWSGALEQISGALDITGHSRLLVLLENRYAPADYNDAQYRLEAVRAGRPVKKSEW